MNTYLLFALIFVLIFYFIIHPIINYLNWIRWWNSNNKIGSKEGGFQCVDLISYAFSKQNYITYKIYNLFNSLSAQVSDLQIEFVTMLLEVYSTEVGGFMLPYHLCKSLVPLQNLQGRNWPVDDPSWIALIGEWAGITGKSFNNVGDYINAVNIDKWTTEPENFLYIQWGLSPYSPLIAGYITNYTVYDSYKLYSKMLSTLLIPSTEEIGGWIGFLNNSGALFKSTTDIYSTIWANLPFPQKVVDHDAKEKAKKNAGCGTGQIISSVAQGTMSGIMVAAMLPPPLDIGGILVSLAIGAATAAGPLISCSQNR